MTNDINHIRILKICIVLNSKRCPGNYCLYERKCCDDHRRLLVQRRLRRLRLPKNS